VTNYPTGITAGNYIDAGGAIHAFLRDLNGTITSFDAMGAGTAPGQGITPLCINSAGSITGLYIDSNGVNHGFVRNP